MNTAIIILGASGDLASRKLIPALNRLYERKILSPGFVLIGSARSALTSEDFRKRSPCAPGFQVLMHYHQGIKGLFSFLQTFGTYDRIVIFMALPPQSYATSAAELHAEGFADQTILVVEKPFGSDYNSALLLNESLSKYFSESQLFRIDHYLAKEAVQNIMVFRFANILFEPIWNNQYVESIQINCHEDLGVAGRAAYFDTAGIIRDMVQNHLIQLLALLCMESPVSLEPIAIREQKMNVLRQLHVQDWAKFQCTEYLQEAGIPRESKTETYATIKIGINNYRWYGVPIYIRAGKYMKRKGTEIAVVFKKLPPILFNNKQNLSQNRIVFKIQPAEGIILEVSSKVPGSDQRISATSMKFCYSDFFSDSEIPEAYTKLLLDALRADQTLFVSASESELSWQKFDEIIKDIRTPIPYEKGSIPDDPVFSSWIDFDSYGSACD